MTRYFAALLRLFPRSFLAEFGPGLREMLSERVREAARQGRIGRSRFVVRETAGLLWLAAGEWVALLRLPRPPAWSGALRQFRRHPLYAFASAGTLALAVAAATVSLAVVDRAFLSPLPYAAGDELVALYTETETWSDSPVSPHVLRDMQESDAPFVEYAPMDPNGIAVAIGEGARQAAGLLVSTSYFSTLGVHPSIGTVWAEGESDAVVLSWDLWQEMLEGDPDPVGRVVQIDGTDRVVTGVMPAGHLPPWFPGTEVWLPLDLDAQLATLTRGQRSLSLVARVAPGTPIAQVDAFLQTFSERMRQEHPDAHGRQRFTAEPLRSVLIGDARPALLGVGAAAALLVLIVGANIAGLATARTLALRGQLAIRVALGATRGRLQFEQFVDALAIAALGTGVGLWLGHMAVTAAASVQSAFLPRMLPVTLDTTSVAVAGALGLVVGVLASVAPRSGLSGGGSESLSSTRGSSGGRKLSVARSGLVVFQVALSLILIVGAGLLVRTVRNLSSTELGFSGEDVVTIFVGLPGSRYEERDAQIEYEIRALERLRAVPGVEEVGASAGVPVIGQSRAAFRVAGVPTEEGPAEVAYFSFAPGYMEMMDIPLLAGRHLTPEDDLASPRVALVNETLASRYWPAGDAVGARIQVGSGSEEDPPITVIGVVADIRQHGPTEVTQPTVFGTTRQFTWPRRYFSVRARDGTAVVPALRAALAEVDDAAPIGRVVSIQELVDERTERHRLVLWTLGAFGLVATALSAFGLFAILSLTSRLRRREYAIRLAVGCERGRVRWMVVRQALVLASAGTVLGVAASALGSRVLTGLLHGVAPLDAWTYASATALVIGIAVVAAWGPARHAGRVDPLEALQSE